MTGLEFLQQLKEMGVAPPAERIGVISGNWSDRELRLASALGCQIFAKPYDISKLYEWIDAVLNERS